MCVACVRVRPTHPPLQTVPLFQRECVRLGDDGDDVDLAVDGLHELHVQRLQADSRMTTIKRE